MLSVVVVGRNDSHGYNLSKRVATSLNSIALPMTGSDELIFVDWNTDDINPTFIDAIKDTLTSHTLKHLVVYRVRSLTHRQITPDSKRPILEPVARNVGIRRAKNPWILSTNTDMILDTHGMSYRDVISRLSPNLYHLFRFEVPEYIWDQFNRMDTEASLKTIQSIFTDRSLTAKILTCPYEGHFNYFPDAVGDFQLAPKEIWEYVRGFPEDMLKGWHVDSRLSAQIELTTGSKSEIINPGTLQGFHQNHLRILTHFHNKIDTNPLEIIAKPYENSSNWGLGDLILENSFQEFISIDTLSSNIDLKGVLPSNSKLLQDILQSPFYDLSLVMLFLLDDVLNLPAGSKICISSINTNLSQNLILLINSLNIESKHLEITDIHENKNQGSIDLFILDFGIPIRQDGSLIDDNLIELFETTVTKNIEILQNLENNQRIVVIKAHHWSIQGLIHEFCSVPLFNNYPSILSGRVTTSHTKTLTTLRIKFTNIIRNRIFLTQSKLSLSNQYRYQFNDYEFFVGRGLDFRLPVTDSITILKIYKKLPFQVRRFLNPKIRKFFKVY